jgi:hypothetical protein
VVRKKRQRSQNSRNNPQVKQADAKQVALPPAKTTEPWEVNVGGPGWLAGSTGNLGTHGVTSHVNIGFKPILLNSNVITVLKGEIRKGRFGLVAVFFT